MNTQPGRFLTEQEIHAFRESWPEQIGSILCVCGHPEGEHMTTGECAIDRADKGHECGCLQFAPRDRTVHYALTPEFKQAIQFNVSVLLSRIPCTCGWIGVYYGSVQAALGGWKRHVAREIDLAGGGSGHHSRALCVCGWTHRAWTRGAAERAAAWHRATGCEGCDHVVMID